MRTISFRDVNRALPVGKILCLGRNYPEHVKEMKASTPDRPIVFMKPATALVHSGGRVVIPPISQEVHHEVEMVVVVGKEARNVPESVAFDYVAGYAVGLDMTLRDVQSEAKKLGLPWTVAKGFDSSAPVSDAVEKEKIVDPHNLTLSLKVNGTLRQRSNTGEMIFRIDHIVSYLSSIFTLEPGDLIFTGTPEGVGRVKAGDVLEAELETVGSLSVRVF